jgi:hypothetical protein
MIFKDEKVRAIMALTCGSGGAEGAEGIRTPDPLDAKAVCWVQPERFVVSPRTAPVEVSSGKRQAHWLSLGGEQGHLSEALTRLWWLVGKGCGGSF